MTTIEAKSKFEFKRMVKVKIQEKAPHYLTSIQATHSKSKNIVYSELALNICLTGLILPLVSVFSS